MKILEMVGNSCKMAGNGQEMPLNGHKIPQNGGETPEAGGQNGCKMLQNVGQIGCEIILLCKFPLFCQAMEWNGF